MSEFVFGVSSDQVDRHVVLLEPNALSDFDSGFRLASSFSDTYFLLTNVFATASSNFITVQNFQQLNVGAVFSNMQADDFAGDISTTGTINPIGSDVTGQIDFDGDADWFVVELTAGEVVEFAISLGSAEVELSLHDENGNFLAFADVRQAGNNMFQQFLFANVDMSGTYYISVSDFIFDQIGESYTIESNIVPDDFSSNTDTTGAVTVDSGPVGGRVDFNADDDWFAVSLIEGETTRISVTTTDFDASNGFNLRLLDVNGDEVETFGQGLPENGEFGELFSVTPLESATYYISVRGFFIDGTDYSVTAESRGDDFAGNASTTGVIDLDGSSISGQIEFDGDNDWFAVELGADEILRVVSDTDNVNLVLRHSDGNFINTSRAVPTRLDDGSTGLGMTANVSIAGTYYVEVNSFKSAIGYTLTGEIITDDFANNETTTAIIPTDGTPFSGRIDFEDDQDWITVTIEADQVISLNLESLGNFTAFALRPQTGFEDLFFFSGNDTEVVFTTEIAGTYYFSINDILSTRAIGDYNVTATTLEDDFASNVSTSGEIILGQSVEGQINFQNDRDWFAVDIVEGQLAQFVVDIPIVDGFPEDLSMELYDESGNVVAFSRTLFSPTGERQILLEVDGTLSGQFYLSVNGVFDTGRVSQPTYTVFSEVFEDDFAGNASTTGELMVGQAVTGTREISSDQDWFRIELTEGESVRIRSDIAQELRLVDEFGTTFVSGNRSSSSDFGGELILDGSLSGVFYVSVSDRFGENGPYTLTSEIVIDDIAGDISTTAVAQIGETLTGSINYFGDEDWFSIQLEEGQLASFISTSSEGGNLQIDLIDENGFSINRSYSSRLEDGSFVQRLDIDGSLSGQFYISISTPFGGERDYEVISTAIVDEFSGDQMTIGQLPEEGSLTSSIDFRNDSDWFAVNLDENDVIRVRVTNDSFGFVNLTLRDENGNFVSFASQFTDLNGETSGQELILDVDVAGTYYVVLDGFDPLNYELSAFTLQDDFANDDSTTGVLSIPGEIAGSIESIDDSDWFGVELTAGELLRFRSEQSDLQLTLFDADGNIVTNSLNLFLQSTQSSVEELLFSVENSGTYFLQVDSPFFGIVGDYLVSSETIIDDLTNDIETSGVISLDGSAMGRIDFNQDEDWFAINLTADENFTLFAEGLLDNSFAINLFDSNGNSVMSFIREEQNLSVDVSGLYYVSVQRFDADDSSYTLFANRVLPIEGTSGDDDLFGTDRRDTINGLAGDDTIFVSLEDDIIDGGEGTDTYDVSQGESANIGYFIDLLDGISVGFGQGVGTDTLISIENVISGSGNDQIIAGNTGSTIFSGAGNDILTGGAGSDIINAEDGNDSFIASVGADTLNGGQGADFITYRFSNDAVVLNFQTAEFSGGYAEGDVLIGLEIITGSGFDDIITGNGETVTLQGGFGNDTIFAAELNDPKQEAFLIGGEFSFGSGLGSNLVGTGDDTLIGSAGRDTLIGLDGADILDGRGGIDTVRYIYDRTTNEGVVIDLEAGTASGGNATGDTILNVENVWGSVYNDDLTGDDNSNELFGWFGSDNLSGLDGDDFIRGGFGSDILSGGAGADIFAYRAGSASFENLDDLNDVITDFENADTISFGESLRISGSDVFLDFIGANDFTGIAGQLRYVAENDQTRIELDIDGNGFSDQSILIDSGAFDLFAFDNDFGGFDLRIGIRGTEDRDTIRGTEIKDIIDGASGNDVIFGEAGDDILFGGDGDDLILGGAGADRLLGGSGNDQLFAASGDDTIDGGAGDDEILGGSGNDVITGGDGNDTIDGQANNDLIDGGAGRDVLSGGNGNDTVLGGMGDDVIKGGDGNDTLEGEDGNDFLGGGSGNDLINGGMGIDNILGGSGDDTLIGGEGNDFINGQANNDIIDGGTGADFLLGGNGRDLIFGGEGDDVVRGEVGNDRLEGGQGNDFLGGGAGNDLLIAGTGADRLYGGSGADALFGQQGEDLLFGGGGNDRLVGGGGADTLNGQSGDDTLEGGSGVDVLTGGSGADTFIFIEVGFSARITDFEDGIDMLDLSDFSDLEIQAVLDDAVQEGTDSILTFANGSVLVLEDFDLNNLSDEDILGYNSPDITMMG